MKNKINELIKKGKIARDESIKGLSYKYLMKAKNNLTTMRLLFEFNSNNKLRDYLKIEEIYTSDEWIVICGYYSMYSSALALLAKIGFKSRNHTATLIVLEEYFVKKKILDEKIYQTLKNVFLKKEELKKISEVKDKREIAQYSATKKTTAEIVREVMVEAYDFVNKIEEILDNF